MRARQARESGNESAKLLHADGVRKAPDDEIAEGQARRQDETPYRLLVEEMSQGALTTTVDGIVLYANRRFAAMVDVPPAKVAGSSLFEWVAPDDRPEFGKLLDQAARGEAKREFDLLRASAATVPTYLCANALPGTDPLQLAMIVTDLTEERQHQRLVTTQEALEASESRLFAASRLRDEFLATISHELRTPLNAILGWATLLKDGRLGQAKAAEAIEIIERNARAQVQLVDDLLDVSRVITGKLHLDVRPLELRPLVASVVDSMRPTFAAKEIAIEAKWGVEDDTISGDLERLQQVIWNLLSNAAKFTPRGGNICVRLDHVGTHVELRVVDSGLGIEPAFLPYVFDRFRQADSTTTRRHSGLGLGLAIVRHLVELHGGTVAAESPGEGQGATFIVRLPVRSAPDASERPAPARERAATRGSESCKIDLHGVTALVVDDQEDAQALIKTLLHDAGAEAVGASAVADALELLTRFTPDVLVADIGMPGEDGYSLIRRVRQQELTRDTHHLPAIALTAYGRAEDRAHALEAGFDAHLRKPVERTDLLVAIAKALGRLRAH